MGEKLVKAYEIANQSGGLQLELRLAVKAGMSRQKASSEPDTPNNILKIEKVLQELLSKHISL